MNLATNARDKLQASAREWMRNLEDVIQKKNTPEAPSSLRDNTTSIENAIRTMFGSCTSGADGATSSPPSVQMEASSSSQSRSRTRSPYNTSPRSKRSNAPRDEAPQQDLGEHIYAQLFFDDQARASKAVSSLRDLEAVKSTTEKTSPSCKNVPKPFHVSSPHRVIPTVTPARPVTAPLSSEELEVPGNLTFDDSISAISAHTLEAMARTVGHTSSDLTNGDSIFQGIPDKRETMMHCSSSPEKMGRSRSNQTWGSKNSTPTVGTRTSQSTRTTESSSFEHMWNQEEQKYWKDETGPAGKHHLKESRRDVPRNRSRSSRKVCFVSSVYTFVSTTFARFVLLIHSLTLDTFFLSITGPQDNECLDTLDSQFLGAFFGIFCPL